MIGSYFFIFSASVASGADESNATAYRCKIQIGFCTGGLGKTVSKAGDMNVQKQCP